ncbi:MAG: GNAT family N-acetyltransferase [Cyanobacteria bacterium P01_H01_bin.15]
MELQYGPPQDTTEERQLGRLVGEAFGVTPEECSRYVTRLGNQRFRILRSVSVQAGLGIYEIAQWFGGKPVKAAGIGGVVVAPESRGQGLGKWLMGELLQELFTQNYGISILYPATQTLYRQLGYEQGGTHCEWSIAPETLRGGEYRLPVTRVDRLNRSIFEPLQARFALHHSGPISRDEALWQSILGTETSVPRYAYVFGEDDGYLIYDSQRTATGFELTVRDWCLLTPAAISRCLRFWQDQRSQIDQIHWVAPTTQSWLVQTAEQTARISKQQHWLLRIVNVTQALMDRGYPSEISGELEFAITDEWIPSNQGNFCLQVSAGQGVVSPGGRGDLSLSIGSLASLFTGLYTASQLAQLGRLNGPNAAIQRADLLFSGPEPWLPDFF